MPMFTENIRTLLSKTQQSLSSAGNIEKDQNLRRYDYLAALYYWFLLCELYKQADNKKPAVRKIKSKLSGIFDYRVVRNVLAHDVGKTIFTDLPCLEATGFFISYNR